MEQSNSSSMAAHLGFRRTRFRLFHGGGRAIRVVTVIDTGNTRRPIRDLLDRARYAAQWRAKVGKIDERKQ
jgi:hypothetical protein